MITYSSEHEFLEAMYSKQRFDVGVFGNAYYVSDTRGNDAFDGSCWGTPLKTIKAALDKVVSGAGDIIWAEAGTYDQAILGVNGLQITQDNVTIAFIGSGVLANTDTTHSGFVLKISGDSVVVKNCTIQKGETTSNNSILVQYSGAVRGSLNDVSLVVEKVNHTGLKLTGGSYGVIMHDQGSGRSGIFGLTGVGIGVEFDSCLFCAIRNTDIGSLTTGALLKASAANTSIDAESTIDNCTTGIELQAGAANNYLDVNVIGCATNYLDNSGVTTNSKEGSLTYLRSSINSILPAQNHTEMLYPVGLGEGVASAPVVLTCQQADENHPAAASKQNYWGVPMVVVPVNALASQWNWIGLNVRLDTAAKNIQYAVYKISTISSAKNGGNAWDVGATVLTVLDGSKFQNGDLVWLYSTYKPNGEILRVNGAPAGNVVTIVRETEFEGHAGVRWNHTTNAAGTEVMYLVRRSSSPYNYERMQFDVEVSNVRDHQEIRWHAPRIMEANAGILIRSFSASDNTNVNTDIRAVYENAYWVT